MKDMNLVFNLVIMMNIPHSMVFSLMQRLLRKLSKMKYTI